MISLAHPRIAREFLVNIGTIVSEGFVDVLLRRRRLGSVEENFIKQLQIGDLFVLGGRVVRLIDTGVQEALCRARRWTSPDGSALERGQDAADFRAGPRRAAIAHRSGIADCAKHANDTESRRLAGRELRNLDRQCAGDRRTIPRAS